MCAASASRIAASSGSTCTCGGLILILFAFQRRPSRAQYAGEDSYVPTLWALFVLDPAVMGGYLHASLGHGDLLVLTWFVAAAATVGVALGTGLESDEALR